MNLDRPSARTAAESSASRKRRKGRLESPQAPHTINVQGLGLQAVVVAAALGIVVLLQSFGRRVRHKAGPVKLG